MPFIIYDFRELYCIETDRLDLGEQVGFCSGNSDRFEFSMTIYKIYQFSEPCNNGSSWFPWKDD